MVVVVVREGDGDGDGGGWEEVAEEKRRRGFGRARSIHIERILKRMGHIERILKRILVEILSTRRNADLQSAEA